jgi:hypothetical protein
LPIHHEKALLHRYPSNGHCLFKRSWMAVVLPKPEGGTASVLEQGNQFDFRKRNFDFLASVFVL